MGTTTKSPTCGLLCNNFKSGMQPILLLSVYIGDVFWRFAERKKKYVEVLVVWLVKTG